MSKSTGNKVRVETWNVNDKDKNFASGRKSVVKVAVRNSKGQFHGATNFRGSFI